ncbi:hypothetical protein HanRHA438_Chr05g0213751 [Helianthus annuus]|nr:hypothetical protein HanIR_Chr05g0220241 [Helianthus annuus]KAJ0746507.1 hypothetical protein HanOQP8_Chr05g0178511 [Helianthus annuus]KAJ0749579.1 hypothetical protein HanLR1_Chr05g0171541 [Helianthus annuus]KAJ0918102.1 hypothetical protein HanRHA438_Chr05g0213751 [Helianthus annuus]
MDLYAILLRLYATTTTSCRHHQMSSLQPLFSGETARVRKMQLEEDDGGGRMWWRWL